DRPFRRNCVRRTQFDTSRGRSPAVPRHEPPNAFAAQRRRAAPVAASAGQAGEQWLPRPALCVEHHKCHGGHKHKCNPKERTRKASVQAKSRLVGLAPFCPDLGCAGTLPARSKTIAQRLTTILAAPTALSRWARCL